MAENRKRRSYTCAKCGVTSKEDISLTFHRFPPPSKFGSLKARVWAKFCFPDQEWSTNESLKLLQSQQKMLCSKHFDDSSFTSSDRKRLNKFAMPSEARNIYSVDQPSTSSNMSYAPEQAQDIQEVKTKGVMKELNANRVTELTPRKQKLYNKCRRNISEISRLRAKLKKVKKCKRNILSTLASSDTVNELVNHKISNSFCLLLQSQLKNVPRKLNGRRWTLDDKILALGIYKKSSACYRLMRRLFCMPSVSSLKALLNKIPMRCGINKQIMLTIKHIAEGRASHENLCILAFDEMAIRKNLLYNPRCDQFDGYQDHGMQGRTGEIASHALTFMAIGLRKPWKQPIAFYFSGDCVTADRLTVLIKEVLTACFLAGLFVIGTVCDLDGVNIRAINNLGSSKDRPYFDHEGHEIVTILDPPHLLKCFRNIFLKHNIHFVQDLQIEGKPSQGIAKWSDIVEFHTKDSQNPNPVFAPALTQQHLQPNGKQKMKVRLAAQILSHSVAAGIFAKVAQNELPSDAIGTATVISNIDKLFDSMNGDTPDKKRGKEFLSNITTKSPYIGFFQKMIFFFNNMKFQGARSKPPSQEGWVRTLNAVQRIFNNLKRQHNITSLSVRRLNQDPLENCFGCIRSNCGCNPNPTSVQFVAAFKTSIITNLINNNKNRNCLDDNNDILYNFRQFLTEKHDDVNNPSIPSVNVGQGEGIETIDIPQCSGEMQACAYVCGFIIKKMAITCTECKKIMLTEPNTEVCHLFTSFKEFNEVRNSLNYVQYNFCQLVENAATIINNFLKKKSHTEKIKYNLIAICEKIDKDWLKGCVIHCEENYKNIIESTIAICLKQFSRKKNLQFVEEASKKSLVRKINILKNV